MLCVRLTLVVQCNHHNQGLLQVTTEQIHTQDIRPNLLLHTATTHWHEFNPRSAKIVRVFSHGTHAGVMRMCRQGWLFLSVCLRGGRGAVGPNGRPRVRAGQRDQPFGSRLAKLGNRKSVRDRISRKGAQCVCTTHFCSKIGKKPRLNFRLYTPPMSSASVLTTIIILLQLY